MRFLERARELAKNSVSIVFQFSLHEIRGEGLRPADGQHAFNSPFMRFELRAIRERYANSVGFQFSLHEILVLLEGQALDLLVDLLSILSS